MDPTNCSHEIQFRGMCAMCFKNLEIPSFEGSHTEKATINMSHNALGLLVSESKAKEIERETAQRLRKQKKLSLILDLDQTVIHATVDRNVGEWLQDVNHPDHHALKNIFHFTLAGDRDKNIYYIKVRPGTFEFLEKAHKLFEMHIYTMGTRPYAEAIAKILDPTGALFNERILSRDDSGSFQEKSVKRIFPGEGETMAVVLDDRGDVWSWSRNLIRVNPFNFFIGTGDINEPLGKSGRKVAPPPNTQESTPAVVAPTADVALPTQSSPTLNTESQTSPKPVETNASSSDTRTENTPEPQITPELAPNPAPSTPQPPVHPNPRATTTRPTQDNDRELEPIWTRLQTIHSRYYNDSFDANLQKHVVEWDSDVRKIMDSMRETVLEGCCLVLSGVVPIGVDIAKHDAYKLAVLFGAEVATDVDEWTTHVVAAKTGTDKVHKGMRRKGVHIVTPDWLYHSVNNWTRLSETVYSLMDQSSRNRTNTNSSVNTDIASLDDDEDGAIFTATLNMGDWADMDAEVDDALAEDSDEEDDLLPNGDEGISKDVQEVEKVEEEEDEFDFDDDLLSREIDELVGAHSDSDEELSFFFLAEK
ncbi:Carboxy-terminal domain (CTD) phosphatase [Chytriomyces hyalinus]|nr:Carboxy-terminal domain (CTD) phosphatase [Chytriomyces hyalinus]